MKDLTKIEELYHAALPLSEQEREVFLRNSCVGDDELRGEVESLLSLEEQATNFIETPPEDIASLIFTKRNYRNVLGKKLNHYQIVSELGKGGMGEVYLAEDTKLDRQVALKILPLEFAADKKRMTRFMREAKSVSALNHPNIITIYEIGEADGINFIAAEYITGETLNKISKTQSVKVQTALDIAIQIVSALEAAHQARIIHRDLKPENIMVRPDGLVKILDFGIAKLSETGVVNFEEEAASGIKSTTTNTGTIIGTATYMSPEQAKGIQVDARSDIFSFGIVFYELLTGEKPFTGENSLEIISSILKDEPQPIRQILPDIPPEIERIVNKTLQKDRDARYQTAHDLLTDLKDVRREFDLFHHSSELRTRFIHTTNDEHQTKKLDTQPMTAEFKRRKFRLTVAISAILFILAGLGVWFFGFRTPGHSAKIDSIAVLPFQNVSGDTETEYLSDGISETLINNFTKIPTLRVIARSTAFRYRGRDGEPQVIGKELRVNAILTGRVLHRADTLSIQVDLINARDGAQIWGNKYDGKASEILEIQQKIAQDVSERLRLGLSGAEKNQVAKNYTENAEAYKFYLRGRFYWNKRTGGDLKKAIQEFKQAADLDPNYALAFVGLADSYVLLEEYASMPSKETLPQAKTFANRALQLDDSLGEAHASLGIVNSFLWQWEEAEKNFKRAIELNPNYPILYHWYCINLRDTGRIAESLKEIKRAQELDPLANIINVNVGMVYWAQGDAAAGIKEVEKVIELDPNYAVGRTILGMILLDQKRYDEAIAEFEKGAQLSKGSSRALAFLGYGKAVAGKRAEALAIVKELEEKYARQEATILNVAMVYAGLGDKEQTFAWLEKTFEVRSGEMGKIRWYPPFASIRNDPRYQSLLVRMGQNP